MCSVLLLLDLELDVQMSTPQLCLLLFYIIYIINIGCESRSSIKSSFLQHKALPSRILGNLKSLTLPTKVNFQGTFRIEGKSFSPVILVEMCQDFS